MQSPFDKGELAGLLLSGGEEYGQVVLQMAILETLLSIEEHLTSIEENLISDGRSESHPDEHATPRHEPI